LAGVVLAIGLALWATRAALRLLRGRAV
jgi:hypothetical protein